MRKTYAIIALGIGISLVAKSEVHAMQSPAIASIQMPPTDELSAAIIAEETPLFIHALGASAWRNEMAAYPAGQNLVIPEIASRCLFR